MVEVGLNRGIPSCNQLPGPPSFEFSLMGQRGCVHGEASFCHHDIVPECLWPSNSLVQVFK